MPASDPVHIYTDGACSGNPGPGGYGVVLIYKTVRKEMKRGFLRTTNNRMELRAVIAGLEELKRPCHARVYSDSQYVVNAMTKGWAKGWKRRGWRKTDGSPRLNADLFEQLLDLCDQHAVVFEWVRGHAGHAENERCDALAVAAREGPLLEDDGWRD
ncbi:MAG: ribonuclease HI [Verrucomicrobiales bacterium]|nr:ribonuclease HI [Verrucomicrobiales bacterium]